MGDAYISVDIGGQTATIILCQCLHAPDVPINLISVGALMKNSMDMGFGKHKTTCYFPQMHKGLKSSSFQADIVGCLSFLNCKFIPPPDPDNIPAFVNAMLPVFQKPELNMYFWHCRTGHPSQETTKHIVSDTARVKRVKWNGKAPHKFCLLCIIGK